MTLILDLDIGVLKMYQHVKIKFLDQGILKLEPKRDRQTDATEVIERISRPTLVVVYS